MIELCRTFQAWLQQRKAQVYQKIPICYNDDDDEESSIPLRDINIFELPSCIAITPVIDPHHLNAESDLIESLLNQDSSIISSLKIDSLLDEFAGGLIFLKSTPPGIDEADCDPEEEIRLIEKFLYDNSSPHVENDDYDSEGDILILEELHSNDSLLLLENESFHFDIPSSLLPPTKPPDDDDIEPNLEIFTVKVAGDISEHYFPILRLLPTQPTLASNQKKFPHLLSHRGLKAFQLSSESPMMIYEGNISILDVLFLHFYPP
nr:hypothetical protein [Tanacetum cinerariifolium]